MEAIERKPHCDREDDRGEVMKEPDEVAAMLRLKELGWGVRRIARELGCSHMTVRRYIAAGGWAPAKVADRPSALDGLEGWLAERLRRHRGNADVVRQDLAREHGMAVSLRTMQRACGGVPAFEGAGVAGGDLIDVSGIDANAAVAGNQAFVFGGSGIGRLSVATSGSNSIVRGNTDKDAAFEFELVIEDGGVLASAYKALDFVL
jgi:hypothetical protein